MEINAQRSLDMKTAKGLLKPKTRQESMQTLQQPSVQVEQKSMNVVQSDSIDIDFNSVLSRKIFPIDWVTDDNGVTYHAPS